MFGVDAGGYFSLYVGAYALAAAGCGVALTRAVEIADGDTRRGLVALLAGSGGWALAQLGYLLAPTTDLRYALYLAGLVIGLTTVGGWLYFASAYTDRTVHRNRTVRRIAVSAYLGIVALKLTNPLHGLYFTARSAAEPFAHLAIQQGLVHWVVAGFSYALVAMGFFMLFERFLSADFDTRPLAALAVVAALPVGFDLLEIASPFLLDMSLEPLGVAAFAVGTLFVFEDRFLSVQLSDGVEDAVVYLDADDRVREYNGRAREAFPELAGAVGRPIAEVLPAAVDRADDADHLLERPGPDGTRYYLVSETDFELGQSSVGGMLMLSDVTDAERRRRELARQNDQLDDFAAAMRHELFNTLQIVDGRLSLAGEELEGGDVRAARESLRTASQTASRMSRLVDDFATLARQGTTLESTRSVAFADCVADARRALEADTDGVRFRREGEGAIEADPDRLRSLFVSAFRFALHNGADRVSVELTADGFRVTDDGNAWPRLDPEAFFEYGSSVPDAEAGIALPNVRTLARVHGWAADVDPTYDGGVRLVVSGARVTDRRASGDGEADAACTPA